MQGDVVFGAAQVYNCRRVRDKMEILANMSFHSLSHEGGVQDKIV